MRLVEGVRKQWLDTDIRKADVQKEPRLQAGHLAKGKLKALSPLKETIVLQVLTAVDISKPAYNQLEGKLDIKCRTVNKGRPPIFGLFYPSSPPLMSPFHPLQTEPY